MNDNRPYQSHAKCKRRLLDPGLERAGQVIDRLTIRIQHPKARRLLIVRQRIHERVRLVKRLAARAGEVGMSVSDRGLRGSRVRALDRPACLRYPNPLALRHGAGIIHRFPEHVPGVVDACGLEVWVSVHAEEVNGAYDRGVGGIDPGSPSVDVGNLFVRCVEAPQHATNIVDLVDQRAGIGVLAVEILRPNTNSDDPVLAMLLDSSHEGLFLRIEMGVIFGPEANENGGACGEGCRDGVGERVAVRGGVEAGTGEVAGERGHGGEVGLPVGLGFAGAVGVVGANVEAFPVGGGC